MNPEGRQGAPIQDTSSLPAWRSSLEAQQARQVFRTINLSVNFIRVGRADPLAIEAIVVAETRQMITVRVTFKREDGELIAEATARQALQAQREAPNPRTLSSSP